MSSPSEIVVKLAPSAAAERSDQRRRLGARAAELGIELEPVDPAGTDRELGAYLVARVENDEAVLDAVVEQLRSCDGVEAAYTKPRGEAPARKGEPCPTIH
jgi:hypothetical protein